MDGIDNPGKRLRSVSGSPHTRLLGLGSALPDRVVSNHDLAAVLDTSDEWIRTRVGIVHRRYAGPETSVADLAVEAGGKALADAGLDPSGVDTVIVATCTMPAPIPNAAAQVADRIGIRAGGAFDLNAACAGFCYAVNTASDLVRSGSAGHVLVIGAEKLTDWVNHSDRNTAIIFGDGAGATVVGPSDEPRIGPVVWGSAGDRVSTVGIWNRTHIEQDGLSVYRWATETAAPVAARAVERAGLRLSDIDALVPHQANLRIVDSIARQLKADGARPDLVVADDIAESGNTSSASIPLALDHMRAAGRITSGDILLLVGFGAGLSYAAQVVICP
ncbi:ketoacyl-ACP synthase III [Streptomyces seoulensis]|uniref:Beta-ketoacyl-[acyl-carrier-protein] synthase III n=1 Tax=Streptomyces seoulensis TaxID=73044 RepID=A0A4P6TX14_STRSO|nr:beta-ketoacyl-ACP synthase III [Streptomyces seoulensis]QBJ91001.1 ketoacyl-ACP synthase III [Streptomyces seoulensis]